MNQDLDNKELFLSWQGQVSGPHTLREVRSLLKLGKVHSLYKIQVEGQWILLRDHLATLEKEARDAASRQAGRASLLQGPSPAVLKPIIVPENDFETGENPELEYEESPVNVDLPVTVPAGLAITSFVLSLFFFVPFLNGITWLLTLIFGHLALSNTGSRPSGKAATLVWIGLWITYVEIGYFLVALAWSAVTEALPMMVVYFLIHWQMLGNAIGALVGAGVLMLALKLASGQLVRFATCFVGALLPSAVSALGMFFLQANNAEFSLTSGRSLQLIALLNLVLFVGQIFFWARFIRLPSGEELGYSRATLASLAYTAVFLFVGIGYAAIFAALVS